MKYISIDLETTGVDWSNDQVLEFGAIIEDTERQLSYEDIPKFSCIIRHKRISGHPVALEMNSRVIKTLSEFESIPSYKQSDKDEFRKKHKIMEASDLVPHFYNFVSEHYFQSPTRFKAGAPMLEFTVAGKTFDAFDRNFLSLWKDFNIFFKMQKRGIEPAHYFVDYKMDKELPSMSVCKERAGIKGNVAHIALADAWDVVLLMRAGIDKMR